MLTVNLAAATAISSRLGPPEVAAGLGAGVGLVANPGAAGVWLGAVLNKVKTIVSEYQALHPRTPAPSGLPNTPIPLVT
jgi:hypothetical protein